MIRRLIIRAEAESDIEEAALVSRASMEACADLSIFAARQMEWAGTANLMANPEGGVLNCYLSCVGFLEVLANIFSRAAWASV